MPARRDASRTACSPIASRSCSGSSTAAGCRTFKPHFWLSDEWFSPDGVPGVAIPFYLAHPRLERLERAYMLEVEGGTPEWCLRILRHEAGHAIDNAYKLRQRRRRQQVFGPSYKAYPEYLRPEAVQQELRPASRQLVRAEPSRRGLRRDVRRLAEPGVGLARALRGLAGAEEARIHGRADEGRRRARSMLVRTHRKRRSAARRSGRRCARTTSASAATTACSTRTSTIAICAGCSRTTRAHATNMKAARFIARVRKDVRRMVASWTGEYQYTIDQVLEAMIKRANELNLRLTVPEEQRARWTSSSCSPCRR